MTADAGTGDLASNAVTIPLSIGPIALAPGEERTICSRFRLPTTAVANVVQIDTVLAPGSHHLIFYKSMATTEKKDIYGCTALDFNDNGASAGDIPIYIAETQANNLLPLPTGAAYKFDAGQMIRLEAHYLNATPNPLQGMGNVRLTEGDAPSYLPADIMFCGSAIELYTTGVPPGKHSLAPGFYKPPAGVKVFGLTTHEHKRGTLMTIDKSTSNMPGTNLTMGTPYDNPPFVIYDDAHLVTFAPNEGLRWQCFYENNDMVTYHFGQSAQTDEMCFLWAYYFPSVGHFISQECVQ